MEVWTNGRGVGKQLMQIREKEQGYVAFSPGHRRATVVKAHNQNN